jgi:peptidoglycan-associated lipoprotein
MEEGSKMKNSLRPLGLVLAAASITILATGCPKKPTPETAPVAPTPAPTAVPAPTRVDDGGYKTQPSPTPVVKEDLTNAAVLEKYVKHVYFDFDKFDIRDDAKATLEKNAEFLRGNPAIRIRIEGHCDERGTDDYNMGLGERRASAVKSYLVTLGVEAGRIETISMGKQRPLDPGHDEAAWAKNRRGHFLPVSGK